MFIIVIINGRFLRDIFLYTFIFQIHSKNTSECNRIHIIKKQKLGVYEGDKESVGKRENYGRGGNIKVSKYNDAHV